MLTLSILKIWSENQNNKELVKTYATKKSS